MTQEQQNLDEQQRVWSWRGWLTLIAAPVLLYCVGFFFTQDLKTITTSLNAMTFGLALGAFMLRIGAIVLGMLSLYRLLFTAPGPLSPNWMVK